jgi:hypothetical protein
MILPRNIMYNVFVCTSFTDTVSSPCLFVLHLLTLLVAQIV